MAMLKIKTKDYATLVSANLYALRQSEDHSYLLDVTLVSSDGKEFLAHKLVLSAASLYFSDLLKVRDFSCL